MATNAPLNRAPRHPATVRATHWLTTVGFLALLISGAEILISHPRFYWGETGNVLMRPLFSLPIASSRATVPTGYRYVLPDQNGWSRYLHFQAAWLLVLTGVIYIAFGLIRGHFRRNLIPSRQELARWKFGRAVLADLHPAPALKVNDNTYNVLQRLTYLLVIFLLFPLVIWSGLAMSPAIAAALPQCVTLLGGHQSARTIHFLVSVAITLFVFVHIVMVTRKGFVARVRSMITGKPL